MSKLLGFGELEQVYDLVAQAIDQAGEQQESLLLAKLCITLAHRVGNIDQVEEAIQIALVQVSGSDAH